MCWHDGSDLTGGTLQPLLASKQALVGLRVICAKKSASQAVFGSSNFGQKRSENRTEISGATLDYSAAADANCILQKKEKRMS